MLNPAIGKLIKNSESRYKLVLDIAKRAREIADEAIKNEEIITEKPVTLALNAMAAKIDDEAEVKDEASAEDNIAD